MRVWQVPSFGIDSLELVDRPTRNPGSAKFSLKFKRFRSITGTS